MEIYDFRDISNAANELSAEVDNLSLAECRRVLNFIASMKKKHPITSPLPISSSVGRDARSALKAYAEKEAALLQIEQGRDGTFLASFYLDGIFEISSEDRGIKDLLNRASNIYIAAENDMASFAIAVNEKDNALD